jgi:hypothetical protein
MGSDGIINTGNSRRVTRNNHENSPGIIRDDRMGIARDDSKETIKDDLLGHYEIYMVSKELKGELGVALIDTGSQVSLVKESSLIRFSQVEEENLQICGITGKQVEINGKAKLKIEKHVRTCMSNVLCC